MQERKDKRCAIAETVRRANARGQPLDKQHGRQDRADDGEGLPRCAGRRGERRDTKKASPSDNASGCHIIGAATRRHPQNAQN